MSILLERPGEGKNRSLPEAADFCDPHGDDQIPPTTVKPVERFPEPVPFDDLRAQDDAEIGGEE